VPTIISPRVDAASNLAPNGSLVVAASNLAKAGGLTETEASELVAWLHEVGYHSIELVHEADRCSVQWIT
jgi:hypothetical protein